MKWFVSAGANILFKVFFSFIIVLISQIICQLVCCYYLFKKALIRVFPYEIDIFCIFFRR
jgi:hypothetical protein